MSILKHLLAEATLLEEATVTKAQVRAMLKDKFKLGFVKMTAGDYKTVTVKRNGKQVTGIEAGGSGPMDVSDAGANRIKKTFADVVKAIETMGVEAQISGGDTCKFTIPGKKPVEFSCYIDRFPTYAPVMRMDSSYQTSWIVFNF